MWTFPMFPIAGYNKLYLELKYFHQQYGDPLMMTYLDRATKGLALLEGYTITKKEVLYAGTPSENMMVFTSGDKEVTPEDCMTMFHEYGWYVLLDDHMKRCRFWLMLSNAAHTPSKTKPVSHG